MYFFRLHPTEAFLRIGLAFAFLYPAVDAFIDPTTWLGYFPAFVVNVFHIIAVPLTLGDVFLLHGFGLLELLLALWVLCAKRVALAAYLMAAILLIIVLTNLDASSFSVLFRDVSLACMAFALATIRLKRP